MIYYSDYELYVSVPIDCTANYNKTDMISASLDVNFYVRLVSIHIFRLESRNLSEQLFQLWVSLVKPIRASTQNIKLAAKTTPDMRSMKYWKDW